MVLFEGLQKNVVLKSEEIKGPNIKSPEVALEGFVRSNKIKKKISTKRKLTKENFIFSRQNQKNCTHMDY